MPGPTTESLATDYRDLARELTATRSDLASFREDFAGFRGRSEAQFGIPRWLGAFMSTILVTLVASAVWLSWHASGLSSRVDGLEKTTVKIVDRLEALEKVSGRIVDRLEALEKVSAKIVDRLDALEKATTRIADRLDKMDRPTNPPKAPNANP